MKRYIYICAFAAAAIAPAQAQVVCVYCYEQNTPASTGINNLLLNGGFESGTCIPFGLPGSGSCCASSIFYSCNINGWNCTGGGSDTRAGICDASYSCIPEGSRAAYFGNGFAHACSPTDDDTSCLSQTLCTITGVAASYPRSNPQNGATSGVSLSQTVAGLVAGNIYVLEFWAGGNYNNMQFMDDGLFSVDVGTGKTFLRIHPTPPLPDSGIGTRYIVEFTATSPSHTITFTNWGHICYDCAELILDDVRLYTLAELSSSVPSCATAINMTDENNFVTVAPNPFNTQINIKLSDSTPSQIILFDISSRKILKQTFSTSVSLNTSQLESGIYFYEVISGNHVASNGKVIKE